MQSRNNLDLFLLQGFSLSCPRLEGMPPREQPGCWRGARYYLRNLVKAHHGAELQHLMKCRTKGVSITVRFITRVLVFGIKASLSLSLALSLALPACNLGCCGSCMPSRIWNRVVKQRNHTQRRQRQYRPRALRTSGQSSDGLGVSS